MLLQKMRHLIPSPTKRIYTTNAGIQHPIRDKYNPISNGQIEDILLNRLAVDTTLFARYGLDLSLP